jgi:hypothetical protein
VLYCAEPFANDNTAISSILKALKRLMAAEERTMQAHATDDLTKSKPSL